MDPKNSGQDCILCRDLKVLLRQGFKSLLQVFVVTCSSLSRPASCASSKIQSRQSFFGCDNIVFFNIFLLTPQSFLCRDRSFFGSLTIYLTRFIVLSVLCHDNLICVYWNSYVATSTIMSRHCFCAASSNLCRDPVFMLQQHFCCFLLQQCFLVLLAFLSRPGKSIVTESCRHLT